MLSFFEVEIVFIHVLSVQVLMVQGPGGSGRGFGAKHPEADDTEYFKIISLLCVEKKRASNTE